jgi:hypothetical protein
MATQAAKRMPNRMVLTDHLAELARLSASKQVVGGGRLVTHATGEETANVLKHWVAHAGGLAPKPAPAAPQAPPALDRLTLDTGYIAFDNGVPVGGSSQLILFPNGDLNFSGHFHDSGAPSYDMSFVIVVASGNTAIEFPLTGRVHGTFEAGSRDWDWNISQNNPAIHDLWGDFSRSYYWHWNAAANADIGQLVTLGLTTVAAAIGIALGAINIVKGLKGK